MSEEFAFELSNPSLHVSAAALNRIGEIIQSSHLLRTLMILNDGDRKKISKSIMSVINGFLDYISKKEDNIKIDDPMVIDKYEYYFHMENLKYGQKVYMFVPELKHMDIKSAITVNIFIHYLNVSKYIKRISRRAKGSAKRMVEEANKISDDFYAKYEKAKEEKEIVDLDDFCDKYFRVKMYK